MLKRLSFATARQVLIGIWFTFFLVNIAFAIYLYQGGWIEEEDFRLMLERLNSLYVTYLGVIITFFLTKRGKGRETKRRAGISFVIAAFCSLLWNLVIFIFIFRVAVLKIPSSFESSMRQISFLGPLLSWLVAPAIGFYFANSSSPPD